jgi:hypothetical protein
MPGANGDIHLKFKWLAIIVPIAIVLVGAISSSFTMLITNHLELSHQKDKISTHIERGAHADAATRITKLETVLEIEIRNIREELEKINKKIN